MSPYLSEREQIDTCGQNWSVFDTQIKCAVSYILSKNRRLRYELQIWPKKIGIDWILPCTVFRFIKRLLRKPRHNWDHKPWCLGYVTSSARRSEYCAILPIPFRRMCNPTCLYGRPSSRPSALQKGTNGTMSHALENRARRSFPFLSRCWNA